MAEFSESLTIRILGDSSQFQQELESVTRQITDLQSHLSRVSDLTAQFGSAFSQLSGMIRPLSAINNQLSQIELRMRRINRIPLVINVAPAMSALNALLGMLNAVIARMQAISSISASASTASGGANSGTAAAAVPPSGPRMNQGGLVLGASGVDRVPALLSAGEFVIRRSVVQQLGTSLLSALNRDGLQSLPRGSRSGTRRFGKNANGPGMSERLFQYLRNRNQKNMLEERIGSSAGSTDSTVNHHGDISIHVQQAVDVNALVRDMRFADYRLRNRRG